MAIIKRSSTEGIRYQVKLQGSDGKWISLTCRTRQEAEKKQAELKRSKSGGSFVSNESRQLSMDEYFNLWHQDTEGTQASNGWRDAQIQMYRDYIQPILGGIRLQAINPAMIMRVLQNMKKQNRSNQTCLHVYNVLHKIFRDAVETHEVTDRNPVKRSLKPDLEQKEAAFLDVEEVKKLLHYVRGKSYDLAIWLGICVGLRVGEIQALLWENVDLNRGLIRVRRTYVRREHRFKEYPKGRRWHDVAIPPELADMLSTAKEQREGMYVVTSPRRPFLSYDGYLKALKRYCQELGLKDLATHSLRHSTSSLWMEYGASDTDMQMLFAHSSPKVTEKYIHFHTVRRLGKVANVIRLFPTKEMTDENSRSSQNLPKRVLEVVDAG